MEAFPKVCNRFQLYYCASVLLANSISNSWASNGTGTFLGGKFHFSKYGSNYLSLKMLSCIPELPDDGRELFVFATELIGPAITMIVSESVPSIQCGTFLTLNIYNLIFARPSGISKKTVQMQHRLVVALIIQVRMSFYDDFQNKNKFRHPLHYFFSWSLSMFSLHLYTLTIRISFIAIWYFLLLQFTVLLPHLLWCSPINHIETLPFLRSNDFS